MLVEESVLTSVEPGVTVHGMDIGRWLQKRRQHTVWTALMDGQRQRLEQLGITPLAPAPETEVPAAPSTAPVNAFETGVAALTQQYQSPHRLPGGPQSRCGAAG
jgi:hypothetical protein